MLPAGSYKHSRSTLRAPSLAGLPDSETDWEVWNPASLELCPRTREGYTMGVMSHLPNQAQLTGPSPRSLNLNGVQAKAAAKIGAFLK